MAKTNAPISLPYSYQNLGMTAGPQSSINGTSALPANAPMNYSMSPAGYGNVDQMMSESEQIPGSLTNTFNPPPADNSLTQAGNAVSAISSAVSWIPGVGQILGGVGAVGGMILSAFGMNEADKARKEAADQAQSNFEQQFGENTRRYNIGVGLEKTQMRQAAGQAAAQNALASREVTVKEKESAANIELSKESLALQQKSQTINQAINMISGMLRFANSPENRSQFVSLWARR
jgi:hypothetical protein